MYVPKFWSHLSVPNFKQVPWPQLVNDKRVHFMIYSEINAFQVNIDIIPSFTQTSDHYT